MTRALESLEIWHDELTPSRAVIQARLPMATVEVGMSLVGFVRGPRCTRGSTLPATYRFNAAKDKDLSSLAATALVTEPVFWTPDWPALYDVTVELRRGGETIDLATRTIGMRPLAVLEKGFSLGGKRWILRGVRRDHDLEAAIDECRQHAATLIAPAERLDQPLLAEASQQGVFVVAELQSKTTIHLELSRPGRFSAVAMAVLPAGELPLDRLPRTNLLLAQRVERQHGHAPPVDVRVVLADVVSEREFADWAKTAPRPVIACRPLARPADIAEARAECDRLQRDLAPYGQFAGYIV